MAGKPISNSQKQASCNTCLSIRLPSGSVAKVDMQRKRVKNLNLRVHANGEVTLSIPVRCPLSTAQIFLQRKAGWIEGQLKKHGTAGDAAQKANAKKLRLSIPLWGKHVHTAEALDISPHELELMSSEQLCNAIDELYKREILRHAPKYIEHYEQLMGVRVTRVSVRKMKTRWGSCTPKTGAIRLACALASYPLECLDFVVAHELVHLLEPSHNAHFHTLLDAYCPNNHKAAALLKKCA